MRWYTCTPRDYEGGDDFFSRDTGLLCKGFSQIGIESRAIMIGSPRLSDNPAVFRANIKKLESADWWASLNLNGVVLYAWGRPRYLKVAKAIHKAGIFLVLHQDSGGIISPLSGMINWLLDQKNITGNFFGFLRSVTRGMTLGLFMTDPLRAIHLRQGDVIGCVTPTAVFNYRKICRLYGGKSLTDRVELIPHAVETAFCFKGATKKKQVVSIGRWSDEVQKRQRLMTEVFSMLLSMDDSVSFVIVGETTDYLNQWHQALDMGLQARVRLCGRLDRAQLALLLDESQIFYSPSAYESFGIAAAEALCSGCSVVAHRSVSMASFEWFVSEKSGTLAEVDSVDAHVEALSAELETWGNGGRNAQDISRTWCQRLHANHVAKHVVAICEKKFQGSSFQFQESKRKNHFFNFFPNNL